jgi:threonine dehydrogenase-like Zn-dependent dehydrogenase
LAAAALHGGIFGTELFNLIVSVIIVLMFAAPYMVGNAASWADRWLSLVSQRSQSNSEEENQAPPEATSRVLVIGLGPAGLQVVQGLLAHQLSPVVVDINSQSQKVASRLGVESHLGDAGHGDVLTHVNLQDICMAVVTVPDPKTAIRIIRLLRQLKPSLAIAARCRYNRYMDDMSAAGADMVVDEETGIGKQLIATITGQLSEDTGVAFACRIAGKVDTAS